MSINEIEQSLPNGFHDALLRGFRVDYVRGTVVFDLELWVGGLDSEDESSREAYRRANLTVAGLISLTVDCPYEDVLGEGANGLYIDFAPPETASQFWNLPALDLPDGAFRSTFYFQEEPVKAIHVAGSSAHIDWVTEPRLVY